MNKKLRSFFNRPDYGDGSTGLETLWEGAVDEAKALFEPEYLIREIEPDTYEVSKWTHGSGPVEIYTVRMFKNKKTCTCPARGVCKHIKMVREWIKKGKNPPIPLSNLDVGKIKYFKRLGEQLEPKEKEYLYKLLKYHGTKDNPSSKESWGTHCKDRFKELTDMVYSEENVKKAWRMV